MRYPCLLLFVSILIMSGCSTSPTARTPSSDYDAIIKAAAKKADQGQLEEAMSDLNQVIAADPKNATAYSSRAGIYLRKGNTGAALSDIDKALALMPKAGDYLTRSQLRADRKDWDGALRDIDAALKINAHSALAYWLRGGLKTQHKDYAGAIADYDQSLLILADASAPDYFQLVLSLTDRGEAKEYNKDYAGAIDDYTKAIKFQNDLPGRKIAEPCYKRGRAKYWKKDYAGAIRDLTQSLSSEITSDTQKAFAYDYLGLCRQKENDVDGAIRDFDTSLKFRVSYLTLSNRGMAKLLKGSPGEALADLNEAIKLDPKSMLIVYDRGRVKMALDDPRGALADFAAALKMDPDFTPACFHMGVAHQTLGDYPAALRSYEKELSEPGDDSIYARILISLLLERMGKSSVAEELSSHVDKWEGEWQKNLALFFTRKISGEELLRRATVGERNRLQAQQCEALYYVGITHLLAGEKLEAKSAFEKCVEVKGTTVSERLLARAELKNL